MAAVTSVKQGLAVISVTCHVSPPSTTRNDMALTIPDGIDNAGAPLLTHGTAVHMLSSFGFGFGYGVCGGVV